MDNFLYVWDRMNRIATRLEQLEKKVEELQPPKPETTLDNLARRGASYPAGVNKWNSVARNGSRFAKDV